jgi:hypothetical protein
MKTFCGLFFLFLFNFSFAQGNDNNWVFGHHAGLDFNSGSPVPFNTNVYFIEGCASISDTAGQLQFFTNGVKVFDRNGVMMQNGDSLATDYPWQYGAWSPQSVVIIPIPGNTTAYYLFTRSDSALSYSVIDMTLNAGLGYVVLRNQVLFNAPVLRYMTAIKHANGADWWLITHGLGTNFMAYQITPSGIQAPVISNVGISYNNAGYSSQCEIVSNLQGSQLAFSSASGIHLVDFDRCTGVYSNFKTISLAETPYSFAYSPDGTKLYYSFHYNQYPTYLYQLCLDCPPPLDSNMIEIFHNYNFTYNLSQIQNGPDGKIYVAIGHWWLPDTTHGPMNMNLSVINDPDQLGLACDFDTATISLGGNWACYGLPNSPYYNMPPMICIDSTAGIADHLAASAFDVFPNPASDKIYFPYSEKVTVSDVAGKIILEKERCSSISVSDLDAGIYFLNFYADGFLISRKILKN